MTDSLSPTHVKLLKNSLSQMQSQLTHLRSHLSQLDATFNKGANVKPVRQRMPRVLKGSSPFSSQSLLSDVIGSVGGTVSSGLSGMDSGDSSSSFSSGQMMGELASAVTRALKRNV